MSRNPCIRSLPACNCPTPAHSKDAATAFISSCASHQPPLLHCCIRVCSVVWPVYCHGRAHGGPFIQSAQKRAGHQPNMTTAPRSRIIIHPPSFCAPRSGLDIVVLLPVMATVLNWIWSASTANSQFEAEKGEREQHTYAHINAMHRHTRTPHRCVAWCKSCTPLLSVCVPAHSSECTPASTHSVWRISGRQWALTSKHEKQGKDKKGQNATSMAVLCDESTHSHCVLLLSFDVISSSGVCLARSISTAGSDAAALTTASNTTTSFIHRINNIDASVHWSHGSNAAPPLAISAKSMRSNISLLTVFPHQPSLHQPHRHQSSPLEPLNVNSIANAKSRCRVKVLSSNWNIHLPTLMLLQLHLIPIQHSLSPISMIQFNSFVASAANHHSWLSAVIVEQEWPSSACHTRTWREWVISQQC